MGFLRFRREKREQLNEQLQRIREKEPKWREGDETKDAFLERRREFERSHMKSFAEEKIVQTDLFGLYWRLGYGSERKKIIFDCLLRSGNLEELNERVRLLVELAHEIYASAPDRYFPGPYRGTLKDIIGTDGWLRRNNWTRTKSSNYDMVFGYEILRMLDETVEIEVKYLRNQHVDHKIKETKREIGRRNRFVSQEDSSEYKKNSAYRYVGTVFIPPSCSAGEYISDPEGPVELEETIFHRTEIFIPYLKVDHGYEDRKKVQVQSKATATFARTMRAIGKMIKWAMIAGLVGLMDFAGYPFGLPPIHRFVNPTFYKIYALTESRAEREALGCLYLEASEIPRIKCTEEIMRRRAE